MKINLDAIVWKFPNAAISIAGEHTYQNMKWLDSRPKPSESEVTKIEKEYNQFITVDKPLQDAKDKRKDELRFKKLDELIAPQLDTINNASSIAQVNAVNLP